jgi:hypothetical protein
VFDLLVQVVDRSSDLRVSVYGGQLDNVNCCGCALCRELKQYALVLLLQSVDRGGSFVGSGSGICCGDLLCCKQ